MILIIGDNDLCPLSQCLIFFREFAVVPKGTACVN